MPWGVWCRSYLRGSHKLGCASSDFVRTHHQFLKFPSALHHQIGCIPGSQKGTRQIMSRTAATPYDPASREHSRPGPSLCSPRRSRLPFQLSVPLTSLPTVHFQGADCLPSVAVWDGSMELGVGLRSPGSDRHLHHDSGSPAHGFGGRDESFRPSGILGIKLFRRCCALRK